MGYVRYAEWMDAFSKKFVEIAEETQSVDELSRIVRESFAKLAEEERLALELYHFLGQTPEQIGAEMDLSVRKVERLLRVGRLKLRRLLAEFVYQRFGIAQENTVVCQICSSDRLLAAEVIIGSKTPEETWRRVIQELGEKLAIYVPSPQTVIGHVKYHMLGSSDSAVAKNRTTNRRNDKQVNN